MATIATLLGLLNIVAGLMFVGATLMFIGGFIRYLILLGNDKRKDGLATMYWGVTILFVLVVIQGAINMLEGPLAFLVGVGAVLFAFFAVLALLSKEKKPEPEHK